MTDHLAFSEEHADALREVANIAMGQAGDSLARVFDTFVNLSVPSVRIVESKSIADTLDAVAGGHRIVHAVRQAFFSQPTGEAIILFDEEGCIDLASLMGYDDIDSPEEQELLLDVGNIIASACLSGIASQLQTELNYTPPRMLASRVGARQLFTDHQPNWTHSLLVNLDFGVEGHSFTCELFIFMPDSSIELIRDSLNALLDTL